MSSVLHRKKNQIIARIFIASHMKVNELEAELYTVNFVKISFFSTILMRYRPAYSKRGLSPVELDGEGDDDYIATSTR